MKHLKKVGRILFALPFLVFGAFHLMGAQDMAGLVPELFTNILPGSVWVMLTGLIFILTSLGLLLKRWMKWSGKILALQLLIIVLTMHLPNLGDPELGQLAMVSLLKDVALIGGALLLAGASCACGCGSANCGHCQDCKDCTVDVDNGPADTATA